MSTTLPADFAFEPKVWGDHVSAYFDRKMGLGQLAVLDKTLVAAPGMTVNMPYFKKIGDAEEPAADEALSVDKLQDDAFSATVKEIGKAVGVRKAALKKSAAAQEKIFGEVQSQIAQVMAEKVDKDLITEIATVGNYVAGFDAAANTDTCIISRLLQGKITAFGDKQDQAVAVAMHSQHFLSLMNDSTAGFLKADANDPFWGAPGFIGRLLGMALFTLDTLPRLADVGGKQVYAAFAFKPNPFGIMVKEDPEMGMDYDLLHREYVFTGEQWYAVKAFHGKVSADDKRIARMAFATALNA